MLGIVPWLGGGGGGGGGYQLRFVMYSVNMYHS